jgi:hypothetical protein
MSARGRRMYRLAPRVTLFLLPWSDAIASPETIGFVRNEAVLSLTKQADRVYETHRHSDFFAKISDGLSIGTHVHILILKTHSSRMNQKFWFSQAYWIKDGA